MNKLRRSAISGVFLFATLGCDSLATGRIELRPLPSGPRVSVEEVSVVTQRVLARRGFTPAADGCPGARLSLEREYTDLSIRSFGPIDAVACVISDSTRTSVLFLEARVGAGLIPELDLVRRELADSLRGLAVVRLRRR